MTRIPGAAARCSLALACLTAGAAAQETFLLSANSAQEASNGASYRASISADGRYFAFDSDGSNLVAGDTNGARDVFWRDRQFGTTVRVSVSTSGAQATGASESPSISADGRYVAFASGAADLVVGDANSNSDVFVHDMQTGATTVESVGTSGVFGASASRNPDISGDGRYVVFESLAGNFDPLDTNGLNDIYLRDRQTGVTLRISRAAGGGPANGASSKPRISSDGAFICYESAASNLIAGDVNGVSDVFVYDVQAGSTLAVSANPATLIGNAQSLEPDIDATGAFVAFTSFASNLTPNDTNGVQDVLRWRRSNGGIQRMSVSSAGAQTPGQSVNPCISADGSMVAFASFGGNLVSGDTNVAADIFVRDVSAGTTTRSSVDSSGAQSNGNSFTPAISADGTVVAFNSAATNLYAGDVNGAADLLVHGDRCLGAEVYCTAKVNSNGCTPSICSGGSPTLTGPDDFYITAFRVLNQKVGMFFWGHAPFVAPFFGGTRCVAYPVQRAPLLNSGGLLNTNDCSGVYAFHFSQLYMQNWSLTVGSQMYGQFWSRDPFFAPPNNVGLTDAVYFEIYP